MTDKLDNDSDPRRPLRLITVGVFAPGPHERTYRAYTRWYNSTWSGCCEHEIEAVNGSEAKKIAIREHKEQCGG